MSDQVIPAILDDVAHHTQTNYLGVASLTILVWDHIDTFADEIEFIWKNPKGLLIYLFFLNRYLAPLGFSVNLLGYFSPVWTPKMCRHFTRFQFSIATILTNVVAAMMFVRVRALYSGQMWILGGLLSLLLTQFTMMVWLLTRTEALIHSPFSGIRACTMIFDPEVTGIATSAAWLPLLYDSVVLVLVLYRTLPSIRDRNATYMMKRFLEDGLIYYAAIFAVTLVLVIMMLVAPPGLKNSTAQLQGMLSVAMMSRITINLKRSIHKSFGNQQHSSKSTRSTSRGPVILDTLPSGLPVDNEVEDDHPLSQWSKLSRGEIASNRLNHM